VNLETLSQGNSQGIVVDFSAGKFEDIFSSLGEIGRCLIVSMIFVCRNSEESAYRVAHHPVIIWGNHSKSEGEDEDEEIGDCPYDFLPQFSKPRNCTNQCH